ncbi:MAG: hypothetical protein FJ078_05045 [Cyanobacteria bacterium K_DeepCast_35m_m2_155]|nr:hypothetical protein [Cyanobacteria bacterium K_DeepCast_35m_m2_155]
MKPVAAAVEGPTGARQFFTEPLADPGSEQRWRQLQQIRRGLGPRDGLLAALSAGDLEPAPDLLAALVAQLDRAQVETLLAGPVGQDPELLLAAALADWPALAAQPGFVAAWLEPLLRQAASAPWQQQLGWLQLAGHCCDPRVAQALRGCLESAAEPVQAAVLLPLLGLQRRAADAELLLRLALEPGPLQLRRQALEAVAVGLTAWPQRPLIAALTTLARDIDAGLAAKAVDLLARIQAATHALRQLLASELDAAVRARLQRRLRCAPLLLVVHGRQGGVIPQALQQLALELAALRGAPVLLQALTGDAPLPDAAFWEAGRRAGQCTLVPLLLLPGGHVRCDVPQLAHAWQQQAAAHGVRLRRRPFLGAWPIWQQLLVQHLASEAVEGQQLLWLHHPLEGPLAARYLQHLAALQQAPGLSAPFSAPLQGLEWPTAAESLLLQPFTLAANRLSETLAAAVAERFNAEAGPVVLPPLLEQRVLRGALLHALTSLP